MTAPSENPFAPLLETLEDASASHGELIDAYLTLASRMSGEEGKEVITEVEEKLSRLYKVFKTHISSQNPELSSAALQALGFCLHNPRNSSILSEAEMHELLLKLNGMIKTSDKNVRTRALWVISKQTFPTEVIGKAVSSIIETLEVMFTKGEMHSATLDYEALNVIIRLIEQAPIQMGEESVRWAKLVIPLVVHSAQKVHLRGATALEMGMPLLLQKQHEIASITEQLMTSKLISELQKLFMSKNETYVLKLWPLFVRLLGKALHRSGSFINALLQLEELGFRSGTPMVKKIAFIAWKSLIDNFALNPDILCSAKRLKLLMQPLSSIHVRTETLALTKLEVWWYLLLRLGPYLPANFEQVCVPLIQSTISIDANASPQGSLSRVATPNPATPLHKGAPQYGTPVTPRMNLSSNLGGMATIPSIQLLGLEMLLHFFMGPEILNFAKQNKLALSLEALEHPLIGSPTFFCKHANTLITAVHDSFVAVGKDASDSVINAIWKELISLVKSVIESGNKKERPGSEVLTLLLKSLESIVKSEIFPVSKTLILMEITIKGLPQKVLGSPLYQVANMDILNGTPALFLIQLIFNNSLLQCGTSNESFFVNMETLVVCVLSGPASPLAFSDSVLNAINQNAKHLENKEHLWRMWSIIVNPLTELINQTNEVNQGDALEHNFSAIYSALTLPINHVFSVQKFPVATMKTLLRTWSELYRTFSRCAALVATAEENLCCEELCSKILSSLNEEDFSNLLFLDRLIHVMTVMVDCIDYSPYNIKYQPKVKSQTSSDWSKKKKEPLGKMASLFKLVVKVIHSFHNLSYKEAHSDTLLAVGNSIISILFNVLGHISLPSMIQKVFATLAKPLALLYQNSKADEIPKVYNSLNSKLEKLLGEILACLQSTYTGTYDSELLEHLSPLLCIIFRHKSKQIRKQSAHFWNSTFAKVPLLSYPEELKPILREAKQKCLLLLPGLENVGTMEESSGPYSDTIENSQLNVKISGMEIKSNGKRDSLLAQKKDTKEMKTPTKMKLESLSTKLKKEILLEEEKSTDFVFIPPEGKETKERILTEHQKEVLKTKRGDIPAMYNNLDVSQDTIFSHYSQEESMEVPISAEKEPKKDSDKKIKAEHTKKDITAFQDTTENSRVDEHLENASLSNKECDSVEETNPELPQSRDNDARKKHFISSKKISTERASTTEHHVAVSSSSVSSATLSGAPSQPTSRRQTFITLEKFDGSENRPFSPSPLNSVSSTISVKNNPENKTKADIPPKTKKGEVTVSKSESEKAVNGLKRSGRRASKAEQTGNKRSKPFLRSEQEKKTSESVDGVVALESNSSGMLNQTDCVSDNQTCLSESTMECEDTKHKQPVGNTVVLENSIEEKSLGVNLESKENTPPAVIPADQIVNEDSQTSATSGQKTLRRSLRRRSDIAESTSDSQDKENNHQKKERRKEEEKVLQKSPLHAKDDALSKRQLVTEKTAQENVIENGNSLPEKTSGETSTNTEMDQNERKPDLENMKIEEDGVQDIADKCSEKPVRGRTRYQTRRASQGLLSSIENSESDSSEVKEEGSKKKRSAKWKNTSSDTEQQEEKVVKEECVRVDSLPHDGKTSSEVDLSSKTFDQKEETIVMPQDSRVSSDLLEVSDVPDTHEGKSKTNRCPEYSISSPPVVESNLRTRNANKRMHKRDSSESNTAEESSSAGTPDMSLASEKPVQTPECQHKRSKRVRRSKGCECCGEKSQPQEKPSIGLKTMENSNLKIMETKKTDLQTTVTIPETSKVDQHSEGKLSDKYHSVSFNLGLKLESDTCNDSLIVSETELKENTTQESLHSEMTHFNKETHGMDSSQEVTLESQESCDKNFQTVGPDLDLGDSKDVSQANSLLEMKEDPEATTKEPSLENINVAANACRIKESNLEEVEVMELERESSKFESTPSEQENAKTVVSEEETTEKKEGHKESANTAEELNAKLTTEELHSEPSPCNAMLPLQESVQMEISEPITVREPDGGSDKSDAHSPETVNAEVEHCEEARVEEVNDDTNSLNHTEAENIITKTFEPEETETKKLNVEIDDSVFDKLEVNTEERQIDSDKTETNTELNKSEETKLDDNQMIIDNHNEILEEPYHTSDKIESPQSLTSGTTVSELMAADNLSPQKLRELDPCLLSANDSPSGLHALHVWSPLASPSTSILKRGQKRPQEDEIPSPVNKVRRVSFADPIYQAGLADDIDRRCSIVRPHSSSSSSPVLLKSVKTSPTAQSKHNTTSAKGFLSPGSRSPKFKSSKKCLIAEMAKESVSSPTESVYPALVNCVAPVDIILPQITSNMWARGLGQLIRAKNIKTIGDLSTLTASEIKTLPIRSPKVSNVKKALRIYHEQQMKSRGLEEIPVFDISEKTLNGIESKSPSSEEEKFASDLIDPVSLDSPLSKNLVAQISALALQLNSEDLHNYSGSQLFEMHEKLGSMANSIIKNLQSRWRSLIPEESI
ncbi:PREDICTED: telomere-associated protein RIF1 [Elephantulus edwardii]|uniref:telomere-associated protein RIF1 n=1 Tax=Elephantulus edwardii TaxID=28737 RepID=UPI0003F07EB7|nr:PREDICTED: telomere-associated protein RIF1 [Elephantulus edwardii]